MNERTEWKEYESTNEEIKISFVHKKETFAVPWEIWTLEPWFTRPVL